VRSEALRVSPLGAGAKLMLALRIWAIFAYVRWHVHRSELPTLVRRLGTPRRNARRRHSPRRLSRGVDRALRIGSRRPTCLVNALVLFRLLREQGEEAQVVIGLPLHAPNHEAHAWVELGGLDVGPPPGRAGRSSVARFP
jgi:Transglutaminase-like superfamily